MSGRKNIRWDGTIVKEEDLTPEIREELGIDENGNPLEEEEEFTEEYESEEDLARGLGFYVDDDGHWYPRDDEDDW